MSLAVVTELSTGFLGGSDDSVTLKCKNGPEITGRLKIIAIHTDLAQMLGAYDAHLDLPHEGPPGPAGAVGATGATGVAGVAGAIGSAGLVGLTGPAGQLPTLGTPDFASLLQVLAASLGALTSRRSTTGGFPDLPPAPVASPAADAPVFERVAAGGTVNVPVVPGSTSDPAGTRRPVFPQARITREEAVEIVRRILNEIQARRAQRRAQELVDRQLAAFRAVLAARQVQLERERRAVMPFGQAGFAAPIIGPVAGGVIGGLAGDAFEFLLERLFPGNTGPIAQPFPPPQQFPSFPAFPPLPAGPALPALPPGIPGLSGGAGVCPPLFRAGASAMRVSPTPWFPVQAPDGKWFFFGHLGKPSFSKLKKPRRHHHHARKR